MNDPKEGGSAPASTAGGEPLIRRFRRWLIWGLAVGVVLYLGGSLWVGLGQVGGELAHFTWWLAVPILLLTLTNYGLRFVKWHLFLRHLGVKVRWRQDLPWFTSGLAMVISPGKAGELLKPYLVREHTGAPMAMTIPALVAERLTDGIAMLILAAFGVMTYASDKVMYVLIPAAAVAGVLGTLASERLSSLCVRVLVALPGLKKLGHKMEETLKALRTCLSPVPLLLAILGSMAAWWAECMGYWLVFKGLGVSVSLGLCTFLYAFATIAGGALPGGLGVADGALGGGAMQLVAGITEPAAIASAILVRFATLWFGVGIGAIVLFRVGASVSTTSLAGGDALPTPAALGSDPLTPSGRA
jgi:glycosyltransferase 2 family protein